MSGGGSNRRRRHGIGPGPAPPTLPVRPHDALFDFEPGQYVTENLVYDDVRIDGGMSVVLRVVHTVDRKPRACKVLLPELAADPDMVHSVVREFARAKRVTGRHAVALYDLGALHAEYAGGTVELPLFTMEWIEGETLGGILRRSPEGLDPEVAFGLAIQLAEGVASLHRAEVLHLDLKPANILVDRDNTLKVIDFGVGLDVRRRHDEATAGRWLTSAYAPWELLEGRFERLCPASDVYQAGVILYELFAGAPTKNVSYAALSDRIDYLPPELDELLLRCLADDPRVRPGDGAELLDELQAAFVAFKDNQRANRRRPSTKPRELWEKLKLVAGGDPPMWEHQAALAKALLKELADGGGGGFLGLGARIDAEEVRRLAEQAEVELQKRREQRFRRLLERRDWGGAREMLAELATQVEEAELESYRRALDLEESLHRHKDPARVQSARKRALELMAEAETPDWMRERIAGLLQKLMEDLPFHGAGGVADRLPSPGKPTPGPPSLWTCRIGDEVATAVVVPGAVLRLGRGSWLDEGAGNHVDLRPTPGEAETDPHLEDLCYQISRRHLEISIAGTLVEAACTGRFGADLDGRPLPAGATTPLNDQGEISLALGASRWRYAVRRSTAGLPAAVILDGLGKVGAGRRAVLLVDAVRLGVVFPESGDAPLTLRPAPAGWSCEPHAAGFALAGRPLQPGRPAPWPPGVPLTGPGNLSVTWAGAPATASRPPAPAAADEEPS